MAGSPIAKLRAGLKADLNVGAPVGFLVVPGSYNRKMLSPFPTVVSVEKKSLKTYTDHDECDVVLQARAKNHMPLSMCVTTAWCNSSRVMKLKLDNDWESISNKGAECGVNIRINDLDEYGVTFVSVSGFLF